MLRTKAACVLALCIAMGTACEDSTDVSGSTTYGATLNGANERPNPITTSGTGTFSASLHPTNGTLSYNVTWSGLSGPATVGGHIHGPGGADAVVGVLVDFRNPPTGTTNVQFSNLGAGATLTSGSASGNLNLNLAINANVTGAQFLEYLNTGQLYVNIHTAANGGGEIRGQIQKQ
jgi:hypothetical protein